MSKNIHAALEIGTTRTVLAIGETDQNGRLRITCHSEIPSSGVRKSQIMNINEAAHSIHSVLTDIEKKQDALGSRLTIVTALLAVSGQHIVTDPVSGTVQVEGKTVRAEDIEAVCQNSRQAAETARDREILDIVDQDYVLDQRGGIAAPKGMSGRVLRLNTLMIHADANRINDAKTSADACHLEISEPVFATTCAAEAVLEDHEKKNGVLVLDLGGGSTGYAAYTDGYLVATGAIGVGGDHITNDIAHAFQTSNAQAEGLKTREASAILRPYDADSARVRIERGANSLMDERTISRRALDTVVNARLLELFTVIRETLEEHDLLHRLHSGIVLTGGGARMNDIDVIASEVLGMNVRYGRPIHVDGLEKEEFPPEFAAIAGALLYAQRNSEESHSFLGGILGGIFK